MEGPYSLKKRLLEDVFPYLAIAAITVFQPQVLEISWCWQK